MSITLGATSFGNHIHGTAQVPPWERSESIQRFPGVTGAQVLQGAKHDRIISIPFQLTGYASHLLLQTGISDLSVLQGSTGSLTVDLGGGDSVTFTQCIFVGFEPSEDPWKDGSGVNGWQQKGTLRFRQIAS